MTQSCTFVCLFILALLNCTDDALAKVQTLLRTSFKSVFPSVMSLINSDMFQQSVIHLVPCSALVVSRCHSPISVFKRSFSLTNHHHSLFWWGTELLSSPRWSMLCYLRFTVLSAAPSAAGTQQIHHSSIVNSPNLSFAMEMKCRHLFN